MLEDTVRHKIIVLFSVMVGMFPLSSVGALGFPFDPNANHSPLLILTEFTSQNEFQQYR